MMRFVVLLPDHGLSMTVDSLDQSLDQLRALRKRVESLHSHVTEELKTFLNEDKLTFRRLPTSRAIKNDVNVTTTCTALMALSVAGELDSFYEDKSPDGKAFQAIKAVVEHKWTSSDLKEGNAFTTIMVLRAAGVLARDGKLKVGELLELSHDGLSLRDTLKKTAKEAPEEGAKGAPETLKVRDYAPTPTLGYWFVDAVDALECVNDVPQEIWQALAKWTATQFTRQMSLLVARHETLMDPVAMAMAACLASRLRRILNRRDQDWALKLIEVIPSELELREGVRRFFQEQAPSGVWRKYFPLFHYPEAGSNFTFTFEILEAVLREFESDQILEDPKILEGLERAVQWCEGNRLNYKHKDQLYAGWHSGGELSTLIQGLPESWATGVVHMFLFQLDIVLTNAIQRRLLERYRANPSGGQSREAWDGMIHTSIEVDGTVTTVRALLEKHILKKLEDMKDIRNTLPKHHSALLFGPPGTSKTSLVKNFAKAVGWPYVEINPSHFLSAGLDRIYIRANQIFADLMDLSRVVVLFDEMDTLVRRRPGDKDEQPLDVTREFLTTSMLPKLAELHGRSRVVFFMATNHQGHFDEAIKRPGRFDLLVFMGVPSWEQKREKLFHFFPGVPKGELERIGGVLDGWLKGHDHEQQLLDLFSFGEMKSFFYTLIGENTLGQVFSHERAEDFLSKVTTWGTTLITLHSKKNSDGAEKNGIRSEYDHDKMQSRIQ
jgi:hypothetical protein